LLLFSFCFAVNRNGRTQSLQLQVMQENLKLFENLQSHAEQLESHGEHLYMRHCFSLFVAF